MAEVKVAGALDMIITLACAICSIIILGYCAAVAHFLRRLPEHQEI
jgi:hypothetical protein